MVINKIISMGVISIFLLMSLASLSATCIQATNTGATIYVDDDGVEGPWETFTVNISSKKAINKPILRIFENFPFIFYLLQHFSKL